MNKSFHSSVFMLSHPSFSSGPPVKPEICLTGADFFYFALKNLVLRAGSEIYGSALDFVSKITNSKHPAKRTAGRQIPNKSQIPIFNDQNLSGRNSVCNFEFRSLEIV